MANGTSGLVNIYLWGMHERPHTKHGFTLHAVLSTMEAHTIYFYLETAVISKNERHPPLIVS